jgi:hypothetical protein
VTEPLPAKRPLVAALAAAALALGACGGDDDGGGDENKLDTSSIQERLREKLSEKPSGDVGSQLEISSFECPDEVEKEKGAEFECDIEAQEGLSGTVEVELDDDEGEAVTYEAQLEGENRGVSKAGSLEPGEP